jgi:hypothetical protein
VQKIVSFQGVRTVIILDVKSKDEIMVMPITHPINKSRYVESSSAEVEIEVDFPVKNHNDINKIINNKWITVITKDRLIDRIGTVKSMKMKMYLS